MKKMLCISLAFLLLCATFLSGCAGAEENRITMWGGYSFYFPEYWDARVQMPEIWEMFPRATGTGGSLSVTLPDCADRYGSTGFQGASDETLMKWADEIKGLLPAEGSTAPRLVETRAGRDGIAFLIYDAGNRYYACTLLEGILLTLTFISADNAAEDDPLGLDVLRSAADSFARAQPDMPGDYIIPGGMSFLPLEGAGDAGQMMDAECGYIELFMPIGGKYLSASVQYGIMQDYQHLSLANASVQDVRQITKTIANLYGGMGETMVDLGIILSDTGIPFVLLRVKDSIYGNCVYAVTVEEGWSISIWLEEDAKQQGAADIVKRFVRSYTSAFAKPVQTYARPKLFSFQYPAGFICNDTAYTQYNTADDLWLCMVYDADSVVHVEMKNMRETMGSFSLVSATDKQMENYIGELVQWMTWSTQTAQPAGILRSYEGRIPFPVLLLQDGGVDSYYYAETMADGWSIAFSAGPSQSDKPATAEHLALLEKVIASFRPAGL